MSSPCVIELVDYSEKAIALFGSNGSDGTKAYREVILAAGGKFNPSLKYGEDRSPGWIFPKSQRAKVNKLISDINSGKCTQSEPPIAEESKQSYTRSSNVESIDKRAFMALVSRVEQLEQELYQVKKQAGLPTSNPKAITTTKASMSFEDEDLDEEYEANSTQPAPRLLKKKNK